jgi:transposase
LDKGYDNATGWGVVVEYGYEPHIQLIRDLRPPRKKCHTPRRWVVERTLAWLSKCRAILVRWDKKACNYLGLLKLACALSGSAVTIAWRCSRLVRERSHLPELIRLGHLR